MTARASRFRAALASLPHRHAGAPLPRRLGALAAAALALQACAAGGAATDSALSGSLGDAGTASPSGAAANGSTSAGGTTESGSIGDDTATADAGGAGVDGGAAGAAANGAATSTASQGFDYAPYFYTWAWGNSGTFGSLMSLWKAGVPGATIAFVLANGSCKADTGVQDNLTDAKAFMAAGGKLKASFGGADGTYLDTTCTSAAAFATALENWVDATGITDLDFDIEQDAAFTSAVNTRRATALKQVQADKGVKISFTLAANGSTASDGAGGGLTTQGIALLKAVLAAGVTVSHVNMMTMDYGSGTDMGKTPIGSITGAKNQLKTLIPGLTDAQAWAMIGATPMIGKNDDGTVFTLANAQTLATFAKTNAIGLVAFWAINRDTTGSDYNDASTVNSSNLQFNAILKPQ